MKTAKEIKLTITEYLVLGGLFNSEHMEHDKVRDLLMEIRDSLPKIENDAIIEGMRRAAEIDEIPTVEGYVYLEHYKQAILSAIENLKEV